MLKETEWLTINNVLLELYAQEDFACFAQKLMRVIRMLIPYSKGYLLRSRTQLIHLLMKGRYTKGVEEEPFDASEAI